MNLTLGSLFDGISGFPFIAQINGITSLWSSEIEKAPSSISNRHFPEIRQLGDVTLINGAEIEPVDIVTFGSPCQGLSIANGKRKGLADKRSGLFCHAPRIIREMRESTDGQYPRFAVWENVPGALSSNKGEDFAEVIETLGQVKESGFYVPRPPNGKWSNAGSYMADGFSIAFRILDSQFWGVPQRRRRIFLVVDFRGECAAEILFKPESLRRYKAQGEKPWENFTARTGRGVDGANSGIRDLAYPKPEVARTLQARADSSPCLERGQNFIAYGICSQSSNSMKSSNPNSGIYVADTARTLDEKCGSPDCNQGGIAVVAFHLQQDPITSRGMSPCIGAGSPSGQASIGVCIPIDLRNAAKTTPAADTCGMGIGKDGEPSYTLSSAFTHGVAVYDARGNGDGEIVPTITGDHNGRISDYTAIALDRASFNQGANAQYNIGVDESDTAYSVLANGQGAVCLRKKSIVRRLTPKECERLQGYPDDYTKFGVDGKEISDNARYKALGNSMALPCVNYVIEGIADVMMEESSA